MLSKPWLFWIVVGLQLLIFITILGSHLFAIDSIPRGLHQDEASVALNAATIAENGVDEHGTPYPLYFKAFGEYKNPIYIYLAAGIFKLMGISIFSLKFTSFILFALALVGFFLLLKRVFPKDSLVQTFGLVTFGFLPHYFNLSRVSFEVISQLPFIVWGVYFVHLAFESTKQSPRTKLLFSCIAGLIIGLSIYTYTTARILSFLLLLSVLIVYWTKSTLLQKASLAFSFFAGILPWILFFINDINAVTNRFTSGISYVSYNSIPTTIKSLLFLKQYLSYFSPSFLVIQGDPILRHTIGYGGIVFVSTCILFVCGILAFWQLKLWKQDRFVQLIIINTLCAPLAAALTWESTPHSLRSLLLGMYITLIAMYGLQFLRKTQVNTSLAKASQLLTVAITTLCILLAWEVIDYQTYYFFKYPEISTQVFQGWNFPLAIQRAVDKNPNQVVVSNAALWPSTHLEFSKRIIDNPSNIPVFVGDLKPYPNSCLVYFKDNTEELNMFTDPYTEHSNDDEWVKVRCYESI